MAYRTAEQVRWRQMDFIKGYEIKVSHQHPCRGMCDDLAGIYPKTFKWTGWHPNDICYVIPVIMTDDEYYSGSTDKVVDVPDNFKKWFGENQSKLSNWKSIPYYVQDNENIVTDEKQKRNMRVRKALSLKR